MTKDSQTATVTDVQKALYNAWFFWNSSEMSNSTISSQVHRALEGYGPYEKRKKANAKINR